MISPLMAATRVIEADVVFRYAAAITLLLR